MMKKRKKADSAEINDEQSQLRHILQNLPDPMFVTDREGNVLLSNSTTALALGLSLSQFLNSNVKDLVAKGHYTKTNVFKAIETKTAVTSLLTTKMDLTYLSTSTPIFDQKGDVELVITSARPKALIDQFFNSESSEAVSQRKREVEYLRRCLLEQENFIASSPKMQKAILSANAVAPTDSVVLLYGETGTGKEVLAKYLHRHSKQAEGPFISVNCGALPENLVESELFGYEKGAFTGANPEGNIGLIEAADGGTLFLDEIAELPLHLQSKLLRVLEDSVVRRVGSHAGRKINFRLIAATHKNLDTMKEEGTFRQDLYYRLNVYPIEIPALRERPEDILPLVSHYLEIFNKKYDLDVMLDADTLNAFQHHSWPGNVRELKNEVERRVISRLNTLSQDLFDLTGITSAASLSDGYKFELLGLEGTLKEVTEAVEKKYIQHMLLNCSGKLNETAEKLGIHRSALYRKLKAYELQK